jgi:hypothetical protein
MSDATTTVTTTDGVREPRRVGWGLVVPGVVLVVMAGAVGFLSWTVRYETDCQALFRDPILGGPCVGAHTGPAIAVGVLGVLGLGLIVFGLARRVSGTRLVVAGLLVGAAWALAVHGTSRLVDRDQCGTVIAPQKWTGYPIAPGPWLPSGCPDRLDGRRTQAGALYGSAALLLATLVVVVVRAPDEPDVPARLSR